MQPDIEPLVKVSLEERKLDATKKYDIIDKGVQNTATQYTTTSTVLLERLHYFAGRFRFMLAFCRASYI